MEREARILMDETSQTVKKMQESLAVLGGGVGCRAPDPRWASMLDGGDIQMMKKEWENGKQLMLIRKEVLMDLYRHHFS